MRISDKVCEAKLGFEDVINILESNSGCNLIGVFENTLTSILNKVHDVGGFSVHIVDDEIRIFQHPDAGDIECIIKIKKEE